MMTWTRTGAWVLCVGVVVLTVAGVGAGQNLTVDAETTAGIERPADLAVDHLPGDPNVWLRDLQSGNPPRGVAIQYSESLNDIENIAPLCQGNDIENTDTRVDGLTVSQDHPGRPAWECKSRTSNNRFIQHANAQGDAQNRTAIPGPSDGDPGNPLTLEARSLNNVSYALLPDHSGVLDLPNQDPIWARDGGPSFVSTAIEQELDEPNVACFSGIFGGTRCFDAEGNQLGRRDGIRGVDIHVENEHLWVAERDEDPNQLFRLTTSLVTLNQSDAPGIERPVSVHPRVGLLVHENATEGPDGHLNATGNVTLRDSESLEFIQNVPSQDAGGPGFVRSLDWHPRGEGFYVATDDRVMFFNTTGFRNATNDVLRSNSTKAPDEDVGDGEDFIDESEVARGLGVSEDQGGLFLGILLMVGLAGGGAMSVREIGGAASVLVSSLGAIGGAVIAFVFDWFPLWVVFVTLVIVGAVAAVVLRNRLITGSEDVRPPNKK